MGIYKFKTTYNSGKKSYHEFFILEYLSEFYFMKQWPDSMKTDWSVSKLEKFHDLVSGYENNDDGVYAKKPG